MVAGSRPLKDVLSGMNREGNKRQMVESKDEIDRLSLLPDSILEDILSLIPIKSAAATSILSRRWQYLWTRVTHLDFDLCHLPPSTGSLFDGNDPVFKTVNHILPQLTTTKIHSFRLLLLDSSFFSNDMLDSNYSSLKYWISTICGRHPERIEVTTSFECTLFLPTCVFQCQSVVELTVKGALNTKVPDCALVHLPNLKNLSLHLDVLDTDLLARLFKCCLSLEDLTLSGHFIEGVFSFDLSALNLKRLNIEIIEETLQGLEFVINLSKLEKISLKALTVDSVRFVEYSGALNSAEIYMEYGLIGVNDYVRNTEELSRLISNVKSLCLNISMLGALNGLPVQDDNPEPLLENLTDLSIKSGMVNDNNDSCWNDMLLFLERSPNLEAIDIEFESHTDMIKWDLPPNFEPPLCLTRLKRIEIKDLRLGEIDDINMVAYILSNAEALEVLSVYVSVTTTMDGMGDEYNLCNTLFHLDRSSSIVEIQFFGQHLISASKGFNDTIPCCQIFRLGNLVVS